MNSTTQKIIALVGIVILASIGYGIFSMYQDYQALKAKVAALENLKQVADLQGILVNEQNMGTIVNTHTAQIGQIVNAINYLAAKK